MRLSMTKWDMVWGLLGAASVLAALAFVALGDPAAGFILFATGVVLLHSVRLDRIERDLLELKEKSDK